MPLLLAVEPDSKQSAILKDIARRQLDANLLVVRSTDEAVAAIEKRLPDLILMSALVPPRDEAALNEHLRAMDGAEHVQTVSIPLLAHPSQKRATRSKRFDTFRRKTATTACGCDPSVFASEIATYLKQAAERRPVVVEETPTVSEEEPVLIAEPNAVAEPIVAEAVQAIAEEGPAPPPPTRIPIALIEATSRVPLPPPIADDVFREILEEMPLPRLGRGVAPEPDEGAAAHTASPDLYQELSRRRDSARETNSARSMQIIPAIASESRPVERIELWHSLPLLLHVPPSLQGPDIDERPMAVAPVAESAAPLVVDAPAPAVAVAGTPVMVPAPPVPVAAAPAQPDEWGLYNPSACGFEALFEKLEQLEAPLQRAKPNKTRPRDSGQWHTPPVAVVTESATEPQGRVTDEILQSLRLPPSIAAMSGPQGCRVTRIRKAKRSRKRRFPLGQRSPEPLIIVSKRMLELG